MPNLLLPGLHSSSYHTEQHINVPEAAGPDLMLVRRAQALPTGAAYSLVEIKCVLRLLHHQSTRLVFAGSLVRIVAYGSESLFSPT